MSHLSYRSLPSDPADRAALERHIRIETELADRLRRAPAAERPTLYAEVYDELFRQVPAVPDAIVRQQQVAIELQLLEPLLAPGLRFLEIGGGDGRLAREVAERVGQGWLLEPSDRAFEPENGQLLQRARTAAELGDRLAGRRIDLAYSCNFVEHLHPDDLVGHLCQVCGWLDEGGAYVVVTPSRLYGPHDVSCYFSDQPLGLHLREYTHRELACELGRAGFRRVAALRGIGRPSRVVPLLGFRVAEGFLDLLPKGLRRRVLKALGGPAPFRRLEQVKLIAWKGRRGPGLGSAATQRPGAPGEV